MNTNCTLCGLPQFGGASGYIGPQCSCAFKHGQNHAGIQLGGRVYTQASLDAAVLAAVLAEREQCVKLCDEFAVAVEAASKKRMRLLTAQGRALYGGMCGSAINCAAAIRARGNE